MLGGGCELGREAAPGGPAAEEGGMKLDRFDGAPGAGEIEPLVGNCADDGAGEGCP